MNSWATLRPYIVYNLAEMLKTVGNVDLFFIVRYLYQLQQRIRP